MENVKLPLIVIAGPTASGKSAIAMEICRRVGGEIVSADSMQLYRGMDIGTAKPTPAERAEVPHHMLDVLAPTEKATASEYGIAAKQCVREILSRGKTPVLCGGTGLYIDAVTRPMRFSAPGDEALRAELHAITDGPDGRRVLHDLLAREDPEAANKLHENDVRRVVRAIESVRLTGMTQAELIAADEARTGEFREIVFAPEWPREELYRRIEARVDEMLRRGLVREVQALLDTGVTADMTSMQAIGYKEIAAALRGLSTLEDAVSRIKQGTRNYAKRQGAWLRRDGRVRWISAPGRGSGDIAREIIAVCQREGILF